MRFFQVFVLCDTERAFRVVLPFQLQAECLCAGNYNIRCSSGQSFEVFTLVLTAVAAALVFNVESELPDTLSASGA